MLITSAVILAVLVAADLITKALICPTVIEAGGTMKFIPGLIRFEYTENTGMAWGMFKNATLLLTILTIIACAVFVYVIIKKRDVMPLAIRLGLVMILAGALGNLFDRIFLGYVRDFIAFDFFEFPIFNFADSCVSIGAVLLAFTLIFTRSGRRFFMSLDGEDKAKKAEKPAEETKDEPADD